MQYVSNRTRFAVILSSLLVTVPIAGAASQCKSLSAEACSAEPACRWVNGYVRKDGREVKAYCRKAQARKMGQRSVLPQATADKGEKKG